MKKKNKIDTYRTYHIIISYEPVQRQWQRFFFLVQRNKSSKTTIYRFVRKNVWERKAEPFKTDKKKQSTSSDIIKIQTRLPKEEAEVAIESLQENWRRLNWAEINDNVFSVFRIVCQ